MSQESSQDELTQDELTALAELLVSSQKAKEREALCIRIGISDYSKLDFIYEHSSPSNFAISLIDYLNKVGDTEAICKLCWNELKPSIKKAEYKVFIEKITLKFHCKCGSEADLSEGETTEKKQTYAGINRKKFLRWVGLVGGSLVTAVVGYNIFKNPSFISQKKHPSDEQIYTIVTGGGLDSAWRISMEGNSAALGTRATVNWTQRVERNSEFKLIYKRTHDAYEIRPRIEINGDACLTTFPNGLLSLNKCDDTLRQNFAIDCKKKDITGNLSECFITNKGTNNPIGTEWENPDKSNKPNIENKNYTSDNARWWSFVVQDKR
ncbi:MAG: hypothetical protein KME54_15005 [Tolypothrix brevis GSE-NOS-MK-07-07A]|jgi:hypothetical protein|nr:hypothetical protein [Tolypothrix brevis GSE-NOS-MK-07-07A]